MGRSEERRRSEERERSRMRQIDVSEADGNGNRANDWKGWPACEVSQTEWSRLLVTEIFKTLNRLRRFFDAAGATRFDGPSDDGDFRHSAITLF